MKEYKAPQPFWNDKNVNNKKKVFLAGSIEQGLAENWQTNISKKLSNLDVIIINPRRDDWDSSWVQSVNNPQFYEQVTWEMYGLMNSDVIAMYFDPATKSPISLLELGLHAHDGKLVIYCPNGFWRKGNVDVVAKVYNIPVYTDKDLWTNEIIKRLK